MSDSRPLDVVGLGEAMVEFNQTVPGEPRYLQGFGGDTSNAVIAAARAGARCAYLSRVGDDAFGRELLALWARERVDASQVEVDPHAPTGIYFVTHGQAGHEFTYRRAGSAASRMTPEWVSGTPASSIGRARWLHVSGISLAISAEAREAALQAMRIARNAGTQVSFDTNLRLRLWSLEDARVGMAAAAAISDLFLPSLDDALPLLGMAPTDSDPSACGAAFDQRLNRVLEWAHSLGPRVVALKLGAQGVLLSAPGLRHRIEPLRLQAVDATGAGDCFAGNLLARLSMGDTLIDAARHANAAAALSVQGHGAVAPLPYAEQVRALLR